MRSFSLGFFVRAGSGDEPPARQGLSHFLEHLLFKRTRRRSNVEIARAIDRLGGEVDAFTTKEYTGFYARTLDARFAEAFDLLADVVLAPAFGASDVEIERGVILEEIGEANDNPEDLAHENFVREFWKGHPLGAPILGTVGDGSRDRAGRPLSVSPRALRRREPDRRRRRAGAAGRGDRGGGPALPAGAPHVPRGGRSRPNTLRARTRTSSCGRAGASNRRTCAWGSRRAPQTSPRRYAAALLDVVLGGGMSSRLFQEVRERRGLVYTIGSSLSAYRLGGYEAISAACAPKNLRRVLDVTLGELRKLKRSGVRPRELARARENLTGSMILALESTVSRMSSAARQELYFGRTVSLEEIIAKVAAVTADEIGEEAGRVLDGSSLSVSVVGDAGGLALSAKDLAGAL